MQEELEDEIFKGEDYSKISFAGHSYSHCVFESCNFVESNFSGAKFASCTFKNCNLMLVKMDRCHLFDVSFLDSKIAGGNLHKCDQTFFSITVKDSILIGCNFSGLKMQKFSMTQSRIKECYFVDTDLSGSSFSESDLAGSTFHHCNLKKVNFIKAENYSIDPQSNEIKGAKFSLPEAVSLLSFFEIEIF